MPGSGGGGGGGGLRGSNIEDPSETSTTEARLKDGFAASLQTEARCSTQRDVNRACFMANSLSQKSHQQLALFLAAAPSQPSAVARFIANPYRSLVRSVVWYPSVSKASGRKNAN